MDAGVNVVDTSFIEPGDPIELPVGVEFVVKPTVSAGSRDTVRYHADDHSPADPRTSTVDGLGASGTAGGAGDSGAVRVGDHQSLVHAHPEPAGPRGPVLPARHSST